MDYNKLFSEERSSLFLVFVFRVNLRDSNFCSLCLSKVMHLALLSELDNSAHFFSIVYFREQFDILRICIFIVNE